MIQAFFKWYVRHIHFYSDDSRDSMSGHENMSELVSFCSLCFQKDTGVCVCVYLQMHFWLSGVCAFLCAMCFSVYCHLVRHGVLFASVSPVTCSTCVMISLELLKNFFPIG